MMCVRRMPLLITERYYTISSPLAAPFADVVMGHQETILTRKDIFNQIHRPSYLHLTADTQTHVSKQGGYSFSKADR